MPSYSSSVLEPSWALIRRARMRTTSSSALLCALVLAALCASVAHSQETSATPAFPVDWVTRPTGRDFERHYPRRAMHSGQSGVTILCCVANEDGSLACESAYESPTGAGFGPAAIEIAQSFTMTQADAAIWRASGERIRVPIWFLWAVNTSEVEAAREAVNQATQSICAVETPTPRS